MLVARGFFIVSVLAVLSSAFFLSPGGATATERDSPVERYYGPSEFA